MTDTPGHVIEVSLELKIVHLSPPGSEQEQINREADQERLDRITSQIQDKMYRVFNCYSDDLDSLLRYLKDVSISNTQGSMKPDV